MNQSVFVEETSPKLGENCSSSMFCATPLAFCYNDTCVCSYPYEPVDGRCIHPEYNCNTGPTPLVDGMVIPCKLNFTSSVDDCPETLFCVMLSEPVDSKQLVDGICCNQTTSYYGNYGQCPVGFNEGMENCNARTAASFPFYDVPTDAFASQDIQLSTEIATVTYLSSMNVFLTERILVPQCFSGVPLRDVNTGELVQCTSQSPCPSGFYCIDEFRMCCSDLDLTN
ncbi:hypothetical protein M513_03071 [Trichuris suis]|uniref:EB domain-containing protein n=1 Tax=Trichuris suis TaxID=68888 RepID=A0A085MFF1_9BILA|nr:hypothetical protein M513_03071 [Trichuris suis]